MWYVYILLCQDGSLYTGISTNPDKRLQDHIDGRGSRYTKSHPPLRRVYLEQIGDISTALKREFQIKRWSRAKKISTLKLNIPDLPSPQ